MKKLVFSVVALVAFSFASMANETIKEVKSVRPDGITVEKNTEDKEVEALHCKVTWPNGTSYECWLCKCSDLPKPTQELSQIDQLIAGSPFN